MSCPSSTCNTSSTCSTTSSSPDVDDEEKRSMATSISYLSQQDAINLDVDLMSPEIGYSIDQLMELAGLSCASAIAKSFPAPLSSAVLVICGPGNNGGDGLVAARHLFHFGYHDITVLYPKSTKNELYLRLIQQVKYLGIPVVNTLQDLATLSPTSLASTSTNILSPSSAPFTIIVDAVFGFSFKADSKASIRAPFDDIISYMVTMQNKRIDVRVVSIDIPSGWDVERGDVLQTGFSPDMLISLTAPKLCAKLFVSSAAIPHGSSLDDSPGVSGRKKVHALGGRFLPPKLARKYSISVPAFPRDDQFIFLYNAK